MALDPASVSADFGPGVQTTQPQVTLDGTAKPGANVILAGTPFFTHADTSGNFTFTGVPVKPGANSFDVRATDTAGNTADVMLTVTMHNVTPPTITLSLVNDTGFDAHDLWTSDPTTRVVVDDASPVTLLQAAINGGPWQDVMSRLTGDVLTLDVPLLQKINGGTLPDQEMIIAVQAGDADGNVSRPITLGVLLTRTPPSATFAPSLVSSSDTGASAFDNITKVASPVIRLFAQRGALVTFYEGTNQIGQAYSTGVAQFTPPAFTDGTHSITATIEDQAGNVSARTPALTLTIDTVPPTAPTLTLDPSQQDPVQANYTTSAKVTLHGQTEAGAAVQLVGLGLTATADATGHFTFANVPLAVGANTLTAQASDVAGNVSMFTLTLTRGQLLPPAVAAQAVGGPTVRAVTITGTVSAEAPITSFSAGFDQAPPSRYLNVLFDLMNGSFQLSGDRLAEINGAPLAAGSHVLHLIATDTRGLVSAVSDVPFTLDLSAQANLSTAVTQNAGFYEYTFTLTGPTGQGWAIDRLALPVAASATISSLNTPAGWSAVSSGGAGGVVWQASAPAADVGPDGQIVFGFTSNEPPGGANAALDAVDAQANLSALILTHVLVPLLPSGPAVPDFFTTDAATALNISAAAGLLANDIGSRLVVSASDTATAWGSAVKVNTDGSFTYTPAPRLRGLSAGESVVDRFSYTAADGQGHTGPAVVEITVHGLEQPPTASDLLPDPTRPSLYVRSNTTTQIPTSLVVGAASDTGVNDVLSLVSVAAASASGASVHIVNGKIIYDPTGVASLQTLAPGIRVNDRFTYTVADAMGETASASVVVTVQSPTDLPPTTVPASIPIGEDGKYDGSSLLKYASDPGALPGDPPLQGVVGTITSTQGATVTVAADGTFKYDASAAKTLRSSRPARQRKIRSLGSPAISRVSRRPAASRSPSPV